MKWSSGFLSLLLLGLLIYFWPAQRPDERPPETTPPRKSAPAPTPSPATGRAARKSDRYDFAAIDRQMQTSRRDFARCFLKNPGKSPGRMRLTVQWNGEGRFLSLNLAPDPGAVPRNCISEKIKGWRVKPHPALAPFSYTRPLVLSGP